MAVISLWLGRAKPSISERETNNAAFHLWHVPGLVLVPQRTVTIQTRAQYQQNM